MKLDYSQNPAHLAWCEQQLGLTFPPERFWLSSVDSAGNILGVVVYTRFTKYNCEMSVAAASPRFLSKRVLKALFGYPFNQLGYPRVTAVTSNTNKTAFEFLQRLGFRLEGYLHKWFGNEDGIVMGMLQEECRWL